ncbi:head-tail connector protein [Mesorhizobium sp.]|uniref:head-tail connector protein n=1 Tax=Mesorhizobium sp. TaxID=1871066 RepID=UPI0011FAD8F2|nr:head-tail connector protein [Mesorhizobium sp.]TIL38530.1 MAG: phage gp6-like head-tail connector protein [Mesorhizobium sp.]
MALKLVTAATAPLVTLAEAKRHVHAADFIDDDAYLEALVATATAHIDGASGWLGRAIGSSVWQLRLDCFPCERINIPLPPLQDVTELAYTATDGTSQTITDFREFGVGSANNQGFVLPAYDEDWPDTRDDQPEAVRITFTAGYATIPVQVKHAILLLIGDWYRNRENASEIKLNEMPRGVDALLYPLRFWG